MKFLLSTILSMFLLVASATPAAAAVTCAAALIMSETTYNTLSPADQKTAEDCVTEANRNQDESATAAMNDANLLTESDISTMSGSLGSIGASVEAQAAGVDMSDLSSQSNTLDLLDGATGADISGFASSVSSIEGQINDISANLGSIQAQVATQIASVKAEFDKAKTQVLNDLKAMALQKLGLGFDPTVIINIYKKVMKITKDIAKIQQYLQMAAMLTGSTALGKMAEIGDLATKVLSGDAAMRSFAGNMGVTVPTVTGSIEIWQTEKQAAVIQTFDDVVDDNLTKLADTAASAVSDFTVPKPTPPGP
jgi:hypothetical protein